MRSLTLDSTTTVSNFQKQPHRRAFRKRGSENMQHIYRKTLMQNSDFNKVAKQLY